MGEARMAHRMGVVDYSAGLTVTRSRDRGYDWLPRDLKRRVKRGDQINLDSSGNIIGITSRQEPRSEVTQGKVVFRETQSTADFKAARSAAVAVDQRPLWLQTIMSLERTQVERGGVSFPIIDATGIYPSIDRVKRGLNGHAGRALGLLHKVIERGPVIGASSAFQQEVIDHPTSGVPQIVAVQERDPNPNARVRAFYSVVGGDYVLRAVSGVDKRDVKTILDVFRTEEGYRTDNHGSFSSNSTRE